MSVNFPAIFVVRYQADSGKTPTIDPWRTSKSMDNTPLILGKPWSFTAAADGNRIPRRRSPPEGYQPLPSRRHESAWQQREAFGSAANYHISGILAAFRLLPAAQIVGHTLGNCNRKEA